MKVYLLDIKYYLNQNLLLLSKFGPLESLKNELVLIRKLFLNERYT